jgi:feruloyl esterase
MRTHRGPPVPLVPATGAAASGRAAPPRADDRGRRAGVPGAAFVAALVVLAAPPLRADPPPDAEPAACAALQALDYGEAVGAAVRFSAATDLPAAGDQPAVCRVAGQIAPAVGFEVRLPQAAWNGKLIVTGCSNLCGSVRTAGLEDALARGYAAATTDLGHQGDESDARWARDNPAAEADFGHRATHVTTLLARALVAGYYGSAPEYAYFRGCSTGGRQALVAAGRYPDDFDGIIAGAPFSQTLSVPHMAWVLAANAGPAGAPLLGRREFDLLGRAALAACDGGDGLADGVIGDPESCRFDPATLACPPGARDACLTPDQVAAATRIYAGPRTSRGVPLAPEYPGGAPVGSEFTWAAQLLPAGDRPAPFDFVVQNWSRYLAYEPDPVTPGRLGFDFDRDPARLAATARVGGFRPDLARFRDRGGRLIVYHGWVDESLMPAHTLAWWRATAARLGGDAALADVARLYLVPGMLHCGGGPGAAEVDYLTALERWVEEDEPPDALVAARVREPAPTYVRQPRFPLPPGAVQFTRPLYPYPDVAAYAGSGDPASAGSFVRRQPAATPLPGPPPIPAAVP